MWLFSSRNTALTSPFLKQIGPQTLLHAWMAPYECQSHMALFFLLMCCDFVMDYSSKMGFGSEEFALSLYMAFQTGER